MEPLSHIYGLRLDTLPVELLYEIQLYAFSPGLPQVSKRLHQIFRSTRPSFRADYLLNRVKASENAPISHILRYPICSTEVLGSFVQKARGKISFEPHPHLPKRLFRDLRPKETEGGPAWRDRDHPLPFIKYLYEEAGINAPDANSHNGYALTKAVYAKFVSLARYLLQHGASPDYKRSLSIKVAIRQKDLSLVKLLIERESNGVIGKRRKLLDRVEVNSDMLKEAVKCNARDIAEYLFKEKGCVPDMHTLQMMMQ